MKTKIEFTAVFEDAEEGGYIAFIEEFPGVNTQGESLDEARKNLLEALELVMDTQSTLSQKDIINKKVIK